MMLPDFECWIRPADLRPIMSVYPVARVQSGRLVVVLRNDGVREIYRVADDGIETFERFA